LVQVIASRLSEIYGKEKIFYDEWSIQPGDGIIDEMNKGLNKCKFFFYFVSKKSVESKMVALEWQNALLKSMREDVKFIPVRIENCVVPPILTQTLYIDIVTYGIEVGIRQMIDVIEGNNTFKKSDSSFSNLYCLIDNISPQEMIIEISLS
jgi:toll-interleukin receptor